MARIYLDNCCLGRLFDVKDQDRIRFEADAVMVIMELIQAGHATWVSSYALVRECRRNPDPEVRQRSESLLENVDIMIALESHDQARVEKLQLAGMGFYDAVHLAAAAKGRCDALLTTDDKLIKKAARESVEALGVVVMNPIDWLRKAMP